MLCARVARRLGPALPLAVLGFGLLLSACGQLSPGQSGTANVSGWVHMGPVCSVVTAESSCADVGWKGEVKFTNQSRSVFEARTDKSGKFQLALAPDSYDIALVGPNPMDGGAYETLPTFRGPSRIQLQSGQAVALEFAVETGIR